MRYLGIFPRFLASVIDSLLLLAVLAPLLMLFFGPGYFSLEHTFGPLMEQLDYLRATQEAVSNPTATSAPEMPVPRFPHPLEYVIKLGFPAIAFFLFWRYRSATPGKMIFRAQIVDATTFGPPSSGQLVIRYLGYYLGVCTCFGGFIWACFHPRRQALHDLLGNTVIIVPVAPKKP